MAHISESKKKMIFTVKDVLPGVISQGKITEQCQYTRTEIEHLAKLLETMSANDRTRINVEYQLVLAHYVLAYLEQQSALPQFPAA